jgi:hypothetical protein
MTPKISYEGPSTLQANQLFSATLRVTPGPELRAGARVVLAVRHFSDFGVAQMEDPTAENYVCVEPDAGDSRWALGPPNDWRRHPWNRGLDLVLQAGVLPEGETLSVRLGDTSQGSPGYRAQSFAETAFRFRLGIRPAGDGKWEVLDPEACTPVRVAGNRTAGLRVIVPGATEEVDRTTVRVKPEDAYGNVAGRVPDSCTLLLDDTVPLAQVDFEPEGASEADVSIPADKQWHVVTAATGDGRFWARSNPVGPSPLPGYKLYFGEIHGQSGLCDGTNSPAEIYEYARTAAGLDFAAVSSHDFELTARDWEEIRQATRGAHRPGEFVTFLGYEWSGKPDAGGDNNIYFLDDDGPLVYSAPFGGSDGWDPAGGQVEGARDLSEVIERLAGERFMVVPHCGGRQCNLDYYDPAVMPLFEIQSCHRTYEHVAQEAIRRGHLFGFIGGSDDHRGALGDSHPAARETFFSSHNGLVAAYAENLTRRSLWEAFFARRVYATNGPRIVLTADIDGTIMGGELREPPGSTVQLAFWTRLDGMLDRVEVVRDDEVIRTFRGGGNQVLEFEGTMKLEVEGEPHFYYLRVIQTDGGRAWSSPIRVTPDR